MKLEEIHALHPKGADAATLQQAIGAAEDLRLTLLRRATELEQTRATGLLTLEAKTILKAEQEAAEARLDADRIEALLPAMKDDWRAAVGRETLAELREGVGPVEEAIAALAAWQTDLNTILVLIGKGLKLHDEAHTARQAFLQRVNDAYRSPEVAAAGALGVTVPDMPAALPRNLFPNFSIARALA